jgi:hypothetical protein
MTRLNDTALFQKHTRARRTTSLGARDRAISPGVDRRRRDGRIVPAVWEATAA